MQAKGRRLTRKKKRDFFVAFARDISDVASTCCIYRYIELDLSKRRESFVFSRTSIGQFHFFDTLPNARGAFESSHRYSFDRTFALVFARLVIERVDTLQLMQHQIYNRQSLI